MQRLMRATACLLALLMTTPGVRAAESRKVSVSITGLKYRPATVEVGVGDTVTWTNNDDREHTVTADDGGFDSGKLRPGKSFSRKFDKPGRYAYGSDPSPRTKGVVVVKGR